MKVVAAPRSITTLENHSESWHSIYNKDFNANKTHDNAKFTSVDMLLTQNTSELLRAAILNPWRSLHGESILTLPLHRAIVSGGFLRDALFETAISSKVFPSSDIDIFVLSRKTTVLGNISAMSKLGYSGPKTMSAKVLVNPTIDYPNRVQVDIVDIIDFQEHKKEKIATVSDHVLTFDTDYNMIYCHLLDVIQAIINTPTREPLTLPIYFPKIEVLDDMYNASAGDKCIISSLNQYAIDPSKWSGNSVWRFRAPETFRLCNVHSPLATLSRIVYFYRRTKFSFMKPTNKHINRLLRYSLSDVIQETPRMLPREMNVGFSIRNLSEREE